MSDFLISPYATRLRFDAITDPALRAAFMTIQEALVSAPNQAAAEVAAITLGQLVNHTARAVGG